MFGFKRKTRLEAEVSDLTFRLGMAKMDLTEERTYRTNVSAIEKKRIAQLIKSEKQLLDRNRVQKRIIEQLSADLKGTKEQLAFVTSRLRSFTEL